LRYRFIIRFAQNIDLRGVDECWPWLGQCTTGGHGTVSYTRAPGKYADALAHCVSYVLAKGTVPPNTLVLHSCDNPPCCNPRHLRLGTHLDNSRDERERGRERRGFIPNRPRLGTAAVAQIRQQYAEGEASQMTLAHDYGVSQATISRVVSGG
jgi:hypothetical protein